MGGSYLKGNKGKALGNRGQCLSQGQLGESYQELNVYCDPVGCYLGHALKGGAGVSSRPVQATWPQKINAKAAVLPSSLAKHSTITVLADFFWGGRGDFKIINSLRNSKYLFK